MDRFHRFKAPLFLCLIAFIALSLAAPLLAIANT